MPFRPRTTARGMCRSAAEVEDRTAHQILGSPDDLKVRSVRDCRFPVVSPAGSVFEGVLEKFYDGERDEKTLRLLRLTRGASISLTLRARALSDACLKLGDQMKAEPIPKEGGTVESPTRRKRSRARRSRDLDSGERWCLSPPCLSRRG